MNNLQQLDEPGSGISQLEIIALNTLIKPIFIKNYNLHEALVALENGRDELFKIVYQIKALDRSKRVLIKRPLFIEDSSRYWSAYMLFRHLAIINNTVLKAIHRGFTATSEQMPSNKERLKAVKPELDKNESIALTDFNQSILDMLTLPMHNSEEKLKSLTIPHPWLGELTHLQWIWFAAFHQKIHKKQLERILAELQNH